MRHDFAVEWMRDFTVFQREVENGNEYIHTFVSSLSLALEEFYKDLQYCGVSSKTGEGLDIFLTLIEAATKEYER